MNQEFRNAYKEASKKESKIKVLESLIQNQDPKHSTILAYKGAIAALKGNYSFFPAIKLSHFWEASSYFEKALAANPENLEAVFLRFTVECGVPSLMSYALHLQEDKKKIIALLPQSDLEEDFKQAIAEYLIESGKCNASEKKILEQFL
ncbi:MAG: hypothetical protein OHK0045_09410 [Raineya sp.]